MQIFLTGATKFDGSSTPNQSLGGYISGTEVQNAALNNLFGLVSQYTKQQNRPEYRVIAIYNESGATLTNLKAYFNYASDDSDSGTIDEVEAIFSIGGSAVTLDSCGDLMYGQIIAPGASPYGITFVIADGIDNALSLPDLASESYYIIILKRVLDPVDLSDEDLEDITDGAVVLQTEENIDLVFSWD